MFVGTVSEMKVAIFGSTGGTGRIMVGKALDRGWDVTAAARSPSALPWRQERLRVAEADVMRPKSLDAAVEGQNAVITSVSVGSGLKEGRKPTTLFSEGTRNVIAAMKKQGVGRLVCLSSSAVEPDPALGVFFGKIMRPLLFKEMYEDTSRMEREVRQSGLEWVIVRPSTLTDEPAEGKYILGIDRIPKGWRIPREEVAEFALDQLEDERYLGRSIAMTT
jgi:biliverdin reductase / flavin reductase